MRKPKLRPKGKLILGITGTFGSGKTTVAKLFKSFGVRLISADRIAHSVLRPQGEVYKKIVRTFGSKILKKNKTIDRNKLAQIVFNNRSKLKELNRIMHPKIIGIIKQQINGAREKFIILDAPLLIEANIRGFIDKLLVVKISRDKQLKRLMNKTSLRQTAILKRIRQQIPLRDKVRLADFVIDNSGTIKNTRKQVGKIRRILWKS